MIRLPPSFTRTAPLVHTPPRFRTLLSGGRVVIAEATVGIGRGERVLIVGESGAGKSTLFRAVAGLWRWGSGTIRVPEPDSMMFMPQRPYLPLGTMRAAITYPDAPDAFPEIGRASGRERVCTEG